MAAFAALVAATLAAAGAAAGVNSAWGCLADDAAAATVVCCRFLESYPVSTTVRAVAEV